MADRPAPDWTCPICGPALGMVDEDGPFCIRHGTQEDIDADPDYAKWHSRKEPAGLRHPKGD